MARTSFKTLLRDLIEQVKGSSVPIRSVEYDPSTKRVKIEFGGPGAASVAADKPTEERKLVPGTNIPDDDSPIGVWDSIIETPKFEFDA